ncbi:hypothetical protein GCM10027073_53140 [Streptomyces chlorus]
MVAMGVVTPGASSLGGELGAGVIVVAEHPGDHRSRGLEDEVADRRGASPLGREGQVTESELGCR